MILLVIIKGNEAHFRCVMVSLDVQYYQPQRFFKNKIIIM